MLRHSLLVAASLIMSGIAHAEGEVLHLNLSLPSDPPEAGLSVFDALEDGQVVLLDVSLRPGAEPVIYGDRGDDDSVAFGAIPTKSVSLPSGSNHVLLNVRLGNPEQHAANLLSAEYDPTLISETGFGVVYRLRGCYLPLSISIPTAIQWELHPLPADACGIGD